MTNAAENHTLWGCTYLYSRYKGVPPPPGSTSQIKITPHGVVDLLCMECGKPPIHRGYYTVARRYEFYFRVAKQYFTNERSE